MKKKFIIEWMTCTSCVLLNEKSLNNKKWVNKVLINLATNEIDIDFDEKLILFEDIKKIIESNWFGVVDSSFEKINNNIQINNKIFYRFIFSLLFSLPVMSMMFFEFQINMSYFWINLSMYIYLLLSFIVVFIFWFHFHKNAFKSLLKMNFNMDSLVSLWTLTAFFYSLFAMFYPWLNLYFETSVAIITLINLWKYLENKAKTKAWNAISKLLELWVKNANVIKSNNVIQKNIWEVNIWEIIVVKAWEKIALDWIIIDWSANIDESMLTWESIPVYKEKSNICFGSTINLDGKILVKVTKTNENGILSNIIKLVNDAQSSKAPIQKLVDKISWIFVPFIIIIAILTFWIWYFLTWDINDAIIKAVAVLVIACPCALWLATPTAIMVWTWVGAKNWILIKNSETLEKTKDIDSIVFDKTGTLTNWKLELVDLIVFWIKKEKLLQYAKSLSLLSNHPLSKSISNYKSNSKILKVNNFEEIKWKGIVWKINNQVIKLWNKKLFSNFEFSEQINKQIDNLSKSWKTPIILWTNDTIFWIIWLLDTPKTWVKNIIEKLHSLNIEVIMLTGDTKLTADFIAKNIKIDKVIAELMPEDKLNYIKKLQNQSKKVAFVWDWINDAPALVQADLSIAMWNGSDIAIQGADIVLINWNLHKILYSIELSRQTLRIIKQNLFWAFVYNSTWIPLAALWFLNPIFASFAMSMSSVSVIINSLRLRKFK